MEKLENHNLNPDEVWYLAQFELTKAQRPQFLAHVADRYCKKGSVDIIFNHNRGVLMIPVQRGAYAEFLCHVEERSSVTESELDAETAGLGFELLVDKKNLEEVAKEFPAYIQSFLRKARRLPIHIYLSLSDFIHNRDHPAAIVKRSQTGLVTVSLNPPVA